MASVTQAFQLEAISIPATESSPSRSVVQVEMMIALISDRIAHMGLTARDAQEAAGILMLFISKFYSSVAEAKIAVGQADRASVIAIHKQKAEEKSNASGS